MHTWGGDYLVPIPVFFLKVSAASEALPCVSCCAGGEEAQGHGLSADQQVASWVVQQYGSMGFRRTLTQADVAALEKRARAAWPSSALEPTSWQDFQDWFSKSVKALKQACSHAIAMFGISCFL